jgi:chromosome segregation ATPase
MNFKYLVLFALLGLAACNDTPTDVADNTFSDAANAQLAALNDKVTGLSTKLADSQTKLDQLNGRIGSTDAGIGPVSAKIDALTAQVKGLSDSANASSQTILRLSGDGTTEKPGEIAEARGALAKLIGEKADPATIAGAEKRLDDLKAELKKATDGLSNAQDQMTLLTGEGTPERPGIAKLTSLLAALDAADDSGAIQKARTKLTKLTEDANKIAGILDDAERRLAKLSGDGTEKDPGDIGKALAKLTIAETAVKAAEDRLAALLGNGTAQNPGLIAKARDELAVLTDKAQEFPDNEGAPSMTPESTFTGFPVGSGS